MSSTLDLLRKVNTQQPVQQTTPNLTANPENKGKGLGLYKAHPNGVTRFQQTQIKDSFSSKKVADRGITVHNVISREGMKAVLGKVSVMSNLKDGCRRLLYRLGNKAEKASSDVGGVHRSIIRMAGEYHLMSKNPTPENLESRTKLLNQLNDKLGNLQGKHSAISGGSETKKAIDIKLLRDFVSQEKIVIAKVITPPRIPEAPPLPETSAPKSYTANISSKGGTLAEVINNLNFVNAQDVPEAPPPPPETSDSKSYTANISSKGDTLAEVINNLNFVNPQDVPKVAIRPNAPELRPYTGKVATKGDDLQSVINEIAKKKTETHEISSLPWAKREFEQKSIKDVGVTLSHSTRPDIEKQPPITGKTIAELPGFSFDSPKYLEVEKELKLAMDSNKIENCQEAGKLLGKLLGQIIIDHLKTLAPQERAQFQASLITSKVKDFMQPVLQNLGRLYPGLEENFKTLDNTFAQSLALLEAAHIEMIGALPNRSDESGENIMLDGVAYKMVQKLGQGGLGSVAIYEKKENQSEEAPSRIVVKRSLKENSEFDGEHEEGIEEMTSEIRAHARVGDHPNVVGFRGAIPTPQGGLLLAMDLASGGDLGGLTTKLNEAVKNGLISPESANLVRVTLLKDMVMGLYHLQNHVGIVHMDLKLENFFIQGDGLAQLGDFGISENSLNPKMTDIRLDSVHNKAPEIQIGETVLSRRGGAMKDIAGHLKGEQGKMYSKERDLEMNRVVLEIDEKADVFALGTATYEIFTGRKFIEDLSKTGDWQKPEHALQDFGMDPTRTVTTLGTDGKSINVGSGVTALDRLFNAMLHPDSSQRPGMDDILQHSLFQQKGVGGKEVRSLITLLTNNETPEESLKQASSKMGF